MIKFTHECGQVVAAPDSAAGKSGTCPKCKGVIRLPGPDAADAAVPPLAAAPRLRRTPLPSRSPIAPDLDDAPARRLPPAARTGRVEASITLDPRTATACTQRAIIGHWIVAGLLFLWAAYFYWDSTKAIEVPDYSFDRTSDNPHSSFHTTTKLIEPSAEMKLRVLAAVLLLFGIPIGLHAGIAWMLASLRRTGVALSIATWLLSALYLLILGAMIILMAIFSDTRYFGDPRSESNAKPVIVGLVMIGVAVLFRWLASSINNTAVWKQTVSGFEE